MKISQKRREALKPKKKAAVATVVTPFIGPMFPQKNVDNSSEVLSKLEEISKEVSREPRSVPAPPDNAPVIKEGNSELAQMMTDNTNRIINAINEKKPTSMELIPERQGGIIQRVIIKPLS